MNKRKGRNLKQILVSIYEPFNIRVKIGWSLAGLYIGVLLYFIGLIVVKLISDLYALDQNLPVTPPLCLEGENTILNTCMDEL